ncbi:MULTISPECIES: M48 family metalloprotease [Idiomarina]|uniref:beta-barrel assembly-enhancing protease n=1 Tax=Idiomarina TaxID=135575 RepID=UPI00258025A8|nr:M48 family metalloprotease [Idiomarina sp. T82-3]
MLYLRKTQRFMTSGIALALMLALPSAFQAPEALAQQHRNLPEIGTTGAGFMSIEREKVVGDYYMRQLRATAPIIQDPVLNSYLKDVGQRLVRNADNVRYPFSFFWLNINEINAFAFMGGYVGVHTGLIQQARNESEFAAVLGHEIAHVTQRHIVRSMQEQQQNMPLTIAGVIGSILLGIANPEAGAAGLYTTIGATGQAQINYTRLFEQEADRIGITTLANAGFDPMGAPNFFGRLADQYRYVSKPPEMLLTHPVPESRIADTRTRAEALGRRDVPQSLNFELAKARVDARYTRSTPNSEFVKMTKSDNIITQQAGGYALAIRALDASNPDTAQQWLTPLLERDPRNRFYIDVQTDIYLALEQNGKALDMLKREYTRSPDDPVIILNYANAAIRSNEAELGVKLLRNYLLAEPDSLIALDLLTDAYQRTSDRAAMYETRAEALALRGGFDLAIDQLQTAQNHTQNKLTEKRLNARIDQLRAEKERLKGLL